MNPQLLDCYSSSRSAHLSSGLVEFVLQVRNHSGVRLAVDERGERGERGEEIRFVQMNPRQPDPCRALAVVEELHVACLESGQSVRRTHGLPQDLQRDGRPRRVSYLRGTGRGWPGDCRDL